MTIDHTPVPLPDDTLDAIRAHIKQTLSDAGAFCGQCGFQPGERGCPDCEECWERYADALLPILCGAPADMAALLKKTTQQAERIAELDKDLDEVMAECDRMYDVADRLAYAVAPKEVIGEDSSAWENAYDLITPAAEVARLRAEVVAVRTNTLYEAAANSAECCAIRLRRMAVDARQAGGAR